MKAAAFFDLDDTIISGNSGMKAAIWSFFHGKISLYHAFRTFWRFVLYYIGRKDPETFFRDVYIFMKDRDVVEVRKEYKGFYDRYLSKGIREDALARIRWHKSQGHPIIIVTNSLLDMIMPIKAEVKADHLMATEVGIEKGKYTGLTSVFCYGENKARFIKEYAKRESISLKRSYAYSDNDSDGPLLSAVGHGYAVNPRWRLRRAAKRANWTILRWK
jgi:HAD superfamily hydrolase (TIGR01490 family)